MEVGHLFKSLVYYRGTNYAKQDRVVILERNDSLIRARVRGSQEYAVRIEFSHDEIDSMYCSCAHAVAGNNCKHMVATLIAVHKESDTSFSFNKLLKDDVEPLPTYNYETLLEAAHLLAILNHDDLIAYLIDLFERHPELAQSFVDFEFDIDDLGDLT